MQNRAIKFTFISLLFLPAIFLIALAIIASNINRESIKNQLSNYIQNSTGLRLNILGNIELKLLPRLSLNIENAEVYTSPLFKQDDPLLRVMHMSAVLNPFSLFTKKVRMHKIYLDTVQAHLITNSRGRNNWQPLVTPQEAIKPPIAFAFNANTIMLKHLNLEYDNAVNQSHLSLIDGHILAKDIELGNPIDFERVSLPHVLRDLNIVSRLRANTVAYENRTFNNVNVQVKSDKHQFQLSNIEFDLGGGHAVGSATADLTYFVPQYNIKLKLSGLESLETITQNDIIYAQKADLDFEIHTQGHGKTTMIHQAQGSIDLHAIHGSLQGVSLETIARQINNSFIKRTPLAINDHKKSSIFNQFNAKMKLKNGLLDIVDAQMANNDYKLHTHGRFNFKNSAWNLYLLLNLTAVKYRDIQVELDEFFINPLRNTVPAIITGKTKNFRFNLDTDFVDVSKTILGKSTSDFLKSRGYKPYGESTYEIRKKLYKALEATFNGNEPTAPKEDHAQK